MPKNTQDLPLNRAAPSAHAAAYDPVPKLEARKAARLRAAEEAKARRVTLREIFDRLDDVAYKKTPAAGHRWRWVALADSLGVSYFTVAHWARRGWVPKAAATSIVNLYGAQGVKLGDLYSVKTEESRL